MASNAQILYQFLQNHDLGVYIIIENSKTNLYDYHDVVASDALNDTANGSITMNRLLSLQIKPSDKRSTLHQMELRRKSILYQPGYGLTQQSLGYFV